MQFAITVRNQGTGDVQWYVQAGLYKDRVPAGCGGAIDGGDPWQDIAPLAAGASTTFTLTTTFDPLGTHTAYVYLDYNCTLDEVSGDNNRHGPTP